MAVISEGNPQQHILEASPLLTVAVNTSQAGMKIVGWQEGFSKFDQLPEYADPNIERNVLIIQERKKVDPIKGRMVDVFKYVESLENKNLFPTGDLPKDEEREKHLIYSDVFSARKIFEIISTETAEKIAPTVVQFGLKGMSLEEDQPLLATFEADSQKLPTTEEKKNLIHFQEGLKGCANRMQTIIDGDETVHFDDEFNLILMEEGIEYVIPVDIVISAENIQLPLAEPAISKKPRPQDLHKTPVPFKSDGMVSFDTGFIASATRGDQHIKYGHTLGMVFELYEGDQGKTVFDYSIASERKIPAGHKYGEEVEKLIGEEINPQDPQQHASGGLVNRASTFIYPFAITMATSRYMMQRREERRSLLNTKN